MSMVTSSTRKCTICLRDKFAESLNSPCNSTDIGTPQNEEIWRRFSTLVSRYLNLNLDCTERQKTLNNWKVSPASNTYLCDICHPVAESFCHMYDAWFCQQLEMNRCLEEISKLISTRSEREKITDSDRQFTERKLSFRGALLNQVRRSRERSFPRLTLEDVNFTPNAAEYLERIIIETDPETSCANIKTEAACETFHDDQFQEDEFDPIDLLEDSLKLEEDEDEDYECDSGPGPTNSQEDTSSNFCPDITITISSIQQLVNNARVRQGGESQPHKCPDCPKQFTYQRSLADHKRVDHMGIKTNFCVMCDKNFKTKYLLERHMRSHTKEKPYHCKVCGKEFFVEEPLLEHKRFVHRGERHRCHFCTKEYASRAECRRHERKWHPSDFEEASKSEISTQPLVFNCVLCNKTFSTSGCFERHLRTHTGEQPFQCDICFIRFSQKNNLKRHLMRMHKQDESLL